MLPTQSPWRGDTPACVQVLWHPIPPSLCPILILLHPTPQEYGTTVEALLSLNPTINNKDSIKPGAHPRKGAVRLDGSHRART